MKLDGLLTTLQELAPLDIAESWDNVGLLVGDRHATLSGAMTCLTVTNDSLSEAIDRGANLVIAHHPIPFKPLQKITSDSTTGKLLLLAIRNGIAIYSPHTAWDNAAKGINQQIADLIGLQDIQPMQISEISKWSAIGIGTGRYGKLPTPATANELIERLKPTMNISNPRCTDTHKSISKVGILCGSGGSTLSMAARRGCDALITGEATYHQCLEAQSIGIAVIMVGHHASEFFSMRTMATILQAKFPDQKIWCSERETSEF